MVTKTNEEIGHVEPLEDGVPEARLVLENAVVLNPKVSSFTDREKNVREFQECSLLVGLDHYAATIDAGCPTLAHMHQYARLIVQAKAVGAAGGGKAVRFRVMGVDDASA